MFSREKTKQKCLHTEISLSYLSKALTYNRGPIYANKRVLPDCVSAERM